MIAVLSFLGQRRKAVGYVLAAAAEYVTQLLPQANAGNAQVLHAVVLVLGLALVYFPANDAAQKDAVGSFIDDLIKGDDVPKHAATAPAPESLQG